MLRDPGPDLHAVTPPRLIVALDCPTLGEAVTLAEQVRASADAFKVGLELFVAEGPNAVRSLAGATGRPIFLDLKLHDIPETVERAVARACALGASLLTVHASGGTVMLERAVRRAEKEGTGLTLVAVTVLTSMDDADVARIGIPHDAATQARHLAALAAKAGVSAFVCSPREVAALRADLGSSAMLITPGVRPAGDASGDQKRTDTPAAAIANGATSVVVGRPIRDAADPADAAARIARSLLR